ncbi:DUF6436 domain-containing protein [Alteromonas oceanisediminis]
MIPSTPAVAIVYEAGKLLYLGPYAAGLGCFCANDAPVFTNKNNNS